MINRLFVYGTLAPGRLNEHVLAPIGGRWQPATVKGNLYEEGWGAVVGYPAIVLSEDGPEVHGLLFSAERLDEHWERLDAFEGDGYKRVVTTAVLEDGVAVKAYIYELNEKP